MAMIMSLQWQRSSLCHQAVDPALDRAPCHLSHKIDVLRYCGREVVQDENWYTARSEPRGGEARCDDYGHFARSAGRRTVVSTERHFLQESAGEEVVVGMVPLHTVILQKAPKVGYFVGL
jgi:hypothetical protein